MIDDLLEKINLCSNEAWQMRSVYLNEINDGLIHILFNLFFSTQQKYSLGKACRYVCVHRFSRHRKIMLKRSAKTDERERK